MKPYHQLLSFTVHLLLAWLKSRSLSASLGGMAKFHSPPSCDRGISSSGSPNDKSVLSLIGAAKIGLWGDAVIVAAGASSGNGSDEGFSGAGLGFSSNSGLNRLLSKSGNMFT